MSFGSIPAHKRMGIDPRPAKIQSVDLQMRFAVERMDRQKDIGAGLGRDVPPTLERIAPHFNSMRVVVPVLDPVPPETPTLSSDQAAKMALVSIFERNQQR